jgi:hypothetical protein
MKKSLITIFILTISFQIFSQKQPLRRSDSFFGLHFDLHASKDDSLTGKTLTEGMIDSVLKAVKPDFIQVDCKGHPGIASFPTKVPAGTSVKRIEKDALALFRKVTKKQGVALYVHYSGVWDDAALAKNPHWAVIDKDGKPSSKITSVHSEYVEKLLIPQFKEIADYGIDGIWVDGDCWATVLDYSPLAIEKFKKETGINAVPKSPKDPYFDEFRAFARKSFKNYVAKYTDAIHAYKPSFQVASNWAFSSFMPSPVDLNVDFMSGDISPMNGVNSALIEARVLAAQSKKYKKPWDLMSWSFNTEYNENHAPKTALNLNQEAAEIMAVGGGYQCYFTQNKDLSIKMQDLKRMQEIAEFARKRQPFTQGASAIPQIGLLYSLGDFNKYSNGLFGNGFAMPLKGILQALMDSQNAVEVLSEHHLEGNLDKYPVIIIPEMRNLAPDFIQKLVNYTKNGGNLLVIGNAATKQFKNELAFETVGKGEKKRFWVSINNELAVVNDSLQNVSLSADNQVLGKYFYNNDYRDGEGVSASMKQLGKGKIAGIYFNFGNSYLNLQSPALRDFLKNIVNKLFQNPIVEVSGSKLVHTTVNNMKGKLAINLINSGGNHNSNKIQTFDELPPLSNLSLKIRLDKAPKKIVQQPENLPLKFTYKNGLANLVVPKLEVHSIIMIE